MRELIIAGRRIADDTEPYVIAEIGNNHQGDVSIALQMMAKAEACGASAVKFQRRENATLYSQTLLDKPYDSEHSFGPTYGAHRAALELSALELAACRRATSLDWFATAFDEPSADLLMSLGVPAIKLASGALTDRVLQKHVASLGIPIILSTGGGTEHDIDRAVTTLSAYHNQFALLHCVASYPQRPEDANLRYIPVLRKRYPDTVIGFSSHLPGIAFSLVAYALGASILEHHFTLDRSMKGGDHAFSLEPKGLETLVDDLRKLHAGLGDGVKRFLECERGPISKMRRVLTEQGWQITGAL
jgi:sialic acid synthase